jgi:hypothetical protein
VGSRYLDKNGSDSFHHIPFEWQFPLCKEIARPFEHLCSVVCEKFGAEGEKVIRESFLSDTTHFHSKYPLDGENDQSQKIGKALIRFLAAWGIKKACVSATGKERVE